MEKMKKDLVHGICSNPMIYVRKNIYLFEFIFSCLAGEVNLIKVPPYQPTTDEWPVHGVDIERERLLKGIDTLMQLDVAEQFRAPGNYKYIKIF